MLTIALAIFTYNLRVYCYYETQICGFNIFIKI